MAVYVDELRDSRWLSTRRSCHMMTDGDLVELHAMAEAIGLKRAYFQNHPDHPHYDLTPNMRDRAIWRGAIPVTGKELVRRCSKMFGKERRGE